MADKQTTIIKDKSKHAANWFLLLALALLAIGSLVYTPVVYQAYWKQDHSSKGLTGNWSDLYARWYGARELLLHGRDPYSVQMIAEMQRGFFGRDPLPGETLPEVAVFAMPLYTVFILAPLVPLDFDTVGAITSILLPLCIVAGAALWLLAPGGKAWTQVALVALLAVVWPVTEVVGYLQQLTGLVFLFIAGGVFLLARRRYAWAGILLALSTIKFQESWLLIAMLLLWAVSSWRERRSFVFGFAGALAALVLAAMVLQPDWVLRFVASLARYTADTADWRRFQALPQWVLIVGAGATTAACAWIAWGVRKLASNDPRLIRAEAAALAAAMILLPTQQNYEGVLILPALIILLFSATPLARSGKLGTMGAIALMLAPCLSAAVFGWLEIAGAPMSALPENIRALPYGFFIILPHVAFVALLLKISNDKTANSAPNSLRLARF